MRAHPTTSAGERQHLLRLSDGSLIDADSRTPVTIEKLASGLSIGERFSVIDERSGRRCTYSVLADALRRRVGELDDPMVAGLLRSISTAPDRQDRKVDQQDD